MPKQLIVGDVQPGVWLNLCQPIPSGGEPCIGGEGSAALRRHCQDRAALLSGEWLYGEAKAGFDRVLTGMLADLAEGRDPAVSQDLLAEIEAASDLQVVFSRQVQAALPPFDGTRAAYLIVLSKSAGDLVKGLVDSAIKIRQEPGQRDALRRQSLISQVEALRWRSFAAIEA